LTSLLHIVPPYWQSFTNHNDHSRIRDFKHITNLICRTIEGEEDDVEVGREDEDGVGEGEDAAGSRRTSSTSIATTTTSTSTSNSTSASRKRLATDVGVAPLTKKAKVHVSKAASKPQSKEPKKNSKK
jgi:hypothetical protein